MQKNFFLIFSSILFGYILLRAYYMGFTHDESLTSTYFLEGSTKWILTANNHWLNTILSYFTFQLFGSSELALRLPNVLSFLIYCYFLYKLIIERSTNIIFTILPIIFLMLNPFLIDFFSLSRGYGLAIAFFSGSLYYFLKFHEEKNNNILIKGLFLSILTIYANYSFLIPIFTLQLVYLIYILTEKGKQNFSKKHFLFFSIEIILLFPALINIFLLKRNNQLYYGGTSNIIEDTLLSLFNKTFSVELFNYQSWIILILILILILFGLLKKKQNSLQFISIYIYILLILTIALHYILEIKYPIGRAALYWIVVLGIYFHLFLEYLFQTKQNKILYLFIVTITFISFLVTYSFFATINITYSQIWKYDADSKSMLKILDNNVKDDKEYSLGINWIFEPTINHYRKTKNYTFIESVSRKGINNKEYDYYYIFDNDKIDINCTQEIKVFSNSHTKLIKNCSYNTPVKTSNSQKKFNSNHTTIKGRE